MQNERENYYLIFEVEPEIEGRLSWSVDLIGVADEKQYSNGMMHRTSYKTNYLSSYIAGADVYDRKNNRDINIAIPMKIA